MNLIVSCQKCISTNIFFKPNSIIHCRYLLSHFNQNSEINELLLKLIIFLRGEKSPLWTVENVVCSVSLQEAAIRVSFIKARQMGVCRVQAFAGTKTYRRDGSRSAWELYFTAYGIDERGRHRKFNLPGNERDPVSRCRFDHVTFAPRVFLSFSVCISAEIIAIWHAST